jgi:hypothetical protein
VKNGYAMGCGDIFLYCVMATIARTAHTSVARWQAAWTYLHTGGKERGTTPGQVHPRFFPIP